MQNKTPNHITLVILTIRNNSPRLVEMVDKGGGCTKVVLKGCPVGSVNRKVINAGRRKVEEADRIVLK